MHVFLESVKMAIASLMANKMRALLTMLGIIVGIASVIAIVSLGEGGKNEVLGQFDQIGASTVNISLRLSRAQPGDAITTRDIEAIRQRIDTVKFVTGSIQTITNVSADNHRARAIMAAIDDSYTSFTDIELLHGRVFTEIEHVDGRAVAIVDIEGAHKLFGRENVVGESIMMEKDGKLVKAAIIGVCTSITSDMTNLLSVYGSSGNDIVIPFFVYMPLRTATRLVPVDQGLQAISIMATSAEIADEAAASVVRLLESRRGNAERDVYRTQNMAAVLKQINNIINILTVFISAVAAISLLVGGIGVMNIMLVSVTERTREIGIRKAIGATTTDIMMQFITESIILTLIGGIIGIMAGLGLSYGIAYAVRRIGSITPVLSLPVIVLTVLFASAVGLFFGIYPARKAALLDPIDALRYE